MTENKGDLISREVLKAEIINNFDNLQAYFPKDFIEEIDNAPTVEAIPTELHEKIMDKTAGELLECQSNLRPQGEWIEVKPHQSDLEDGIDYREECSICHEPNRHYGFDEYHDIRFATYYKTKFCPNCGADMRGKENETD